jgi:hypothetical protein
MLIRIPASGGAGKSRSGRAALMRLIIVLLLPLVLLGHSGCSNSSSPTDPPPPPPANPEITFTPANGNPGANTVSLQLNATSGNRLDLDIRLTSVTNVSSMAFDLTFNPNSLSYVMFSEGTFFNQDGEAVSVLVDENPAGRLIVGVARLGDVGGVSGTGVALTLTFNGVSNGGSSMGFENSTLLDPDLNAVDGVQWFGGSATVTGL